MNSSDKGSIYIIPRKTSVRLEDEFWKSLREIVRERGETMPQPITSIDAHRQFAKLLSAIRLFILRYHRDQFDQQKDEIELSSSIQRREH